MTFGTYVQYFGNVAVMMKGSKEKNELFMEKLLYEVKPISIETTLFPFLGKKGIQQDRRISINFKMRFV